MAQPLDLIFQRRSIRRYTEEPITRDQVETILKAAMAAPSASNKQPWHFIVVTKQETRERLAEIMPYGKMLPDAKAALCVCGDLDKAYPDPAMNFWVQDCAAATQNAMLAATGLGLGSVWLGVYPNPERVKNVSSILSLPEKIVPMSLIAIGHPAEQKEPRTQYNPACVQWDE